MLKCFFFSSRRRHTRLQGDWSSDVCSSDLVFCLRDGLKTILDRGCTDDTQTEDVHSFVEARLVELIGDRSEERRVGKECSDWWSAYDGKEVEEYIKEAMVIYIRRESW